MDYYMKSDWPSAQLKQLMKIPSDRPCFSLLVIVLTWIIGCAPPSDAQKKAVTEKVLKEVGVVPEVTLASKVKPEATEIQESIVKKEASKLPGNPSVQLSANSKTSVQAKPSLDDPSRPWISSEKLPRETWEVQYLGNVAVGTFYRKVDVTSRPGFYRHEAKSRMRVSLKGKPLEQRIEIMTLERENGEVEGLEGFLEIGSKKQSFRGTVVQKELRLTGDEDGSHFPFPSNGKRSIEDRLPLTSPCTEVPYSLGKRGCLSTLTRSLEKLSMAGWRQATTSRLQRCWVVPESFWRFVILG